MCRSLRISSGSKGTYQLSLLSSGPSTPIVYQDCPGIWPFSLVLMRSFFESQPPSYFKIKWAHHTTVNLVSIWGRSGGSTFGETLSFQTGYDWRILCVTLSLSFFSRAWQFTWSAWLQWQLWIWAVAAETGFLSSTLIICREFLLGGKFIFLFLSSFQQTQAGPLSKPSLVH